MKAKITEGKTKTLLLLYCLATQGMLFYSFHKGLAQVINFLMVLVDDIDTEMMGFEEGEGKGTLCFFVKPGIYPLKTAFKEEKNIMFTKSNIWNLENSRNKGCLCHWNWALFCYEGYNLGLHHCICIFYHRAPFYPVHRMDSAYGTSISYSFNLRCSMYGERPYLLNITPILSWKIKMPFWNLLLLLIFKFQSICLHEQNIASHSHLRWQGILPTLQKGSEKRLY